MRSVGAERLKADDEEEHKSKRHETDCNTSRVCTSFHGYHPLPLARTNSGDRQDGRRRHDPLTVMRDDVERGTQGSAEGAHQTQTRIEALKA